MSVRSTTRHDDWCMDKDDAKTALKLVATKVATRAAKRAKLWLCNAAAPTSMSCSTAPIAMHAR